jgi:GT2 family glycosyltransferase
MSVGAMSGTVSVVIPALNEGQNLIDTVASVRAHSGPLDPEVIVVDDGSTDGSPQRVAGRFADDPKVRVTAGPGAGIARARNAGAEAAQGEIVVFLDAHCYTRPGWLAPLTDPFADPAVALAGPAIASIRAPTSLACGVTWADPSLSNVWLPATTTGPVPFHIGACQAVRAETFAAVGGFDAGMTRWGSEDVELCLRLWLLGHEVHAAPQSVVFHLFREARPYRVDARLILYNHLRLALLHFDETRLEKVVTQIAHWDVAASAIVLALTGDAAAERAALQAARVRDADWFFRTFGIGF